MKTKIVSLCAIALKLVSVSSLQAATISLSAGTYTENFNSITTTAPSGWDVRTSASSKTLGTVGSYTATIGTVTAWNDTTSGFKNFASSNSLTSAASSAAQNATTDRALGLRQSGSFGDPGASLNFNFSSSSLTVSSITIDLEILSGRQDRQSGQFSTALALRQLRSRRLQHFPIQAPSDRPPLVSLHLSLEQIWIIDLKRGFVLSLCPQQLVAATVTVLESIISLSLPSPKPLPPC
jgi:hypothetical protein